MCEEASNQNQRNRRVMMSSGVRSESSTLAVIMICLPVVSVDDAHK
jgi:hypothetical protein